MEIEEPFFDCQDDINQSQKYINKFPLFELLEQKDTSQLSNNEDSSFFQDQFYSYSTSSQLINQDKNIFNAQKQKKRRAKVQENQILNTRLLNPCRTIKFFSGISITNDGILRFCYSLSQISFGFQQQLVSLVDFNNQEGLANLHLSIDRSLPALPLQEALKFYKQFYNSDFIRISDKLESYDNMMSKLRTQIYNMNLNEDCFQKKEEEFQDFIQQAESYIKQYARENPNQMFQYTFGRVNHKQGDIEITRAGYSKSYLQLLGLHPETFRNIALRQQKIELMRNKEDIQKQSLEGLKYIGHNKKDFLKDCFISEIVTFDGFPLILYQTKINVRLPLKKEQKKQLNLEYPYILSITQMDVELKQLQNLIQYRQKLSLNPKYLTLDEFMQKELSYQFESVEYSVHSQLFLEKYYSDNLQQLKEQEQKFNQQKYAGYKFIQQK
ncbi:hypothetical protein TTHERM_01372810 (macronuclear) [Tetrahymena thermophila SB210]|uniref:Uncharacterized protein n=1 Tax=Tetrahymena thermophila (strain SB210) TaxID=312017 RepID=Q229M8_TETTS|nr:hypothetical protein TTHERM_01372810 [Tetrahymena thermophila SB210]EAR81992.1 hypothetical protein TTHERM_01372810 [Tetrahymena thermophila SB210]|eukprot:XP_001029655.1 hypothetical protein TTHERM_01372810 [Tetrahymena thermophila SB210]